MNLVVLAFVNPPKPLDQTTDSGDVNGVPTGMTSAMPGRRRGRQRRPGLAGAYPWLAGTCP